LLIYNGRRLGIGIAFKRPQQRRIIGQQYIRISSERWITTENVPIGGGVVVAAGFVFAGEQAEKKQREQDCFFHGSDVLYIKMTLSRFVNHSDFVLSSR
jgi:hypothetical protein